MISTPYTGRNRRSLTFWTERLGTRPRRRFTGSRSDLAKPAHCFCIEAEGSVPLLWTHRITGAGYGRMTIVRCKACGTEMRSRAHSCPQGEGRRRTTSGATWGQACAAIIIMVISVAILLAWAKAIGRLN
jgi:hypothetical protein